MSKHPCSFATSIYWQAHYTMCTPDEAHMCSGRWSQEKKRMRECVNELGKWDESSPCLMTWQAISQSILPFIPHWLSNYCRRRKENCRRKYLKWDIVLREIKWWRPPRVLLLLYSCPRCSQRQSLLIILQSQKYTTPPRPPEALDRKRWLANGQGRFRSDRGRVKSPPCSVCSGSHCIFFNWMRLEEGNGWGERWDGQGPFLFCPTGRKREQKLGVFLVNVSPNTGRAFYWCYWCWDLQFSEDSDNLMSLLSLFQL